MFYAEVWGRRAAKYAFLRENTLETVAWTPLTPRAPLYLFVPQDDALQAEYEQGWFRDLSVPDETLQHNGTPFGMFRAYSLDDFNRLALIDRWSPVVVCTGVINVRFGIIKAIDDLVDRRSADIQLSRNL